MAPVVASIEVDRPAVEVFSYATDPRRFHAGWWHVCNELLIRRTLP
jgi:uncharacterized protein YndB with AHSA1/START domain